MKPPNHPICRCMMDIQPQLIFGFLYYDKTQIRWELRYLGFTYGIN
jgi:hypothetical protein